MSDELFPQPKPRIESIRLGNRNVVDVLRWLGNHGGAGDYGPNGTIVLRFLDGDITVHPGEWICQGPRGLYLCLKEPWND